ncbi:MAG TPA: hypothetical protein VEP90_03595, partial [Methylomirabilota bacterium]|nr:hypothetical protein [Methylomirabilota bacterium]
VFLSLEDTQSDTVIQKIREQIKDIDREFSALVLLDNCEQIEDRDEARNKIHNLLMEYPHLTILATSRAQFGNNKDEHELKPLDVPDYETQPVDILKKYESMQLFIEAARTTDKNFALTEENAPTVAALCTIAGGLPLALLLMGYWIIKLKEKTLLDNLFNLQIKHFLLHPKSKQRLTLNQVIEISYNLLDIQEQKLFRRLAVFAGECSLEAIADVCCQDGDLPITANDLNLLHWLDTLKEGFLITFINDMIDIKHVTLRDFAWQKLDENSEEEEEAAKIMGRYLTYYANLYSKLLAESHVSSLSIYVVLDKPGRQVKVFHDYVIEENENLQEISNHTKAMRAFIREYIQATLTEEEIRHEMGKEKYETFKLIIQKY